MVPGDLATALQTAAAKVSEIIERRLGEFGMLDSRGILTFTEVSKVYPNKARRASMLSAVALKLAVDFPWFGYLDPWGRAARFGVGCGLAQTTMLSMTALGVQFAACYP